MSAPELHWLQRGDMARSKETLNLDGLIRREDLESKAEMAKGSGGILPIQLEIGQHYYGLLRKPVFQRETDDWDIDNVVSLIRSFRDGHLIPAVILWAAEGNIFVIDGAHRLSAFIAWINDDYGDRATSEAYFGHHIPKKQKELATQCRKRIDEAGLTYTELLKLSKIANRTEQQALWSVNITQPIEAQWVGGGAATALQSFLDINQRAVVIDKTERYMIEERRAPVIVAARAIVNAARGHKYWGSFDTAFVTAIEQKAELIYDAIFEPEDAQPHKDIFLQPAGNARTAGGLRLCLDLVNLINGISGRSSKLVADSNGSGTASAIEKTWGVVKYIGGGGNASLDLFPAVYFWGETGIHRPSGFLAMTSLVQDMLLGDELRKFTIHRARFEEFLIDKNGGASLNSL
ncbi:MAG: DUF262 domain-containing protein [Polaromonas sp.]|uniref:DUF262 domain-containing protein n=1 Tax=Polaromonas sp. TaxID=1869339 RepID=UPI00272F6EEE|nr:DUF262 domain-containing protein [Polaromonas sp.]MDP2450015.1 DUF262 domain-containing protein [Polaromonas sp.]MDP3246721.1 DUF262 domain-containing protein [Polaromonas sp.]MDP3755971.1 DUF262 domain-containing protein [Polaromonas sp.]